MIPKECRQWHTHTYIQNYTQTWGIISYKYHISLNDKNKQKLTETNKKRTGADRNREKRAEMVRSGQKRTETDRNGQKRTATDRNRKKDRQNLTETVKNRHTQT